MGGGFVVVPVLVLVFGYNTATVTGTLFGRCYAARSDPRVLGVALSALLIVLAL